jgi:hypothetical protein
MEKEPISKKDQTRDTILISLSGGIIGILGAIAESKILSQNNIDLDQAIIAGGSALVGAGLFLNGAVRFITSRQTSKKDKE